MVMIMMKMMIKISCSKVLSDSEEDSGGSSDEYEDDDDVDDEDDDGKNDEDSNGQKMPRQAKRKVSKKMLVRVSKAIENDELSLESAVTVLGSFWAKHVKWKWNVCTLGPWFWKNIWANRLLKSKNTAQNKFVSVKSY